MRKETHAEYGSASRMEGLFPLRRNAAKEQEKKRRRADGAQTARRN